MCNINSPYHGTYEHTIQYQPIAIHTMHHHTVLFNVYSIIHTILHLNIESDGIKILVGQYFGHYDIPKNLVV